MSRSRKGGGTCESCGLALPPGAAHFDASSCVAALRHALEEAEKCVDCGKPLRCPTCIAAAFGKRAATAAGVKIAERLREGGVAGAFRFLEGLGGVPGSPPERSEGEGTGKRFDP